MGKLREQHGAGEASLPLDHFQLIPHPVPVAVDEFEFVDIQLVNGSYLVVTRHAGTSMESIRSCLNLV